MDDWKRRRREKQKLPPPASRTYGLDMDDNDHSSQSRGDRRRINRFENSQYYLVPLDGSEDDKDFGVQPASTTDSAVSTSENRSFESGKPESETESHTLSHEESTTTSKNINGKKK